MGPLVRFCRLPQLVARLIQQLLGFGGMSPHVPLVGPLGSIDLLGSLSDQTLGVNEIVMVDGTTDVRELGKGIYAGEQPGIEKGSKKKWTYFHRGFAPATTLHGA